MSKKNTGISPTLAALTTAAMALPGISSTVNAAVAANEPKLSLQYTRYDEDSIPSGDSDPNAGDRDRYEIDVLQVPAECLDAMARHEEEQHEYSWKHCV